MPSDNTLDSIAREDIWCDADENLWPNPEKMIDWRYCYWSIVSHGPMTDFMVCYGVAFRIPMCVKKKSKLLLR